MQSWYNARSARETVRHAASVALFATLFGIAAGPAHALTITPYFDASVTGAMQGAIDIAIGNFEALYSNPGTVGIDFSEGSGGFLGESEAADYGATYSNYTALLTGASVANPSNTVLATAVANLSKGNQPGSGNFVVFTSADARIALGVASASGCFQTDGTFIPACGQLADGRVIMSNSANFNYSNTAVPGQYTAVATIEHEIDEILGGGGQGSTLNGTPNGNMGVLDLYRYSAPNTPVFSNANSGSCPAYFSVDGGVTDIVNFNQNSGGDFADFCTNNNIQSAFSNQDVSPAYTPATPEFAMMESIGYDGVPEPSSMSVLAAGVFGLRAIRRRRRLTPARDA